MPFINETKPPEFKEIRFVLDNGVEIVVNAAYIREFTLTHNLGYSPLDFSIIPDYSTVDIHLHLRAPSASWQQANRGEYASSGQYAIPEEIEPPAQLLIENKVD